MANFLSSNGEIFLRLLLATILGVIVGFERTKAHKTAGMRTFGLVAMGSALFVCISQIVSQQYPSAGIDPLRMASQIIVGIGFLGVGLVVLKESKLMGLTTAAGLWVSAGIGIAAGYGLYSLAVFSTVLTIVVFTILWLLEEKVRPGEEEQE